MSSFTVKPWVEKKISEELTMQDLIDTPLDEALAKLEARVAENKIALAVQEMEVHKGRLELQQYLKGVAEWRRYKAEYIADQLRVREEKLAEKCAAKRARTQNHL